MRTRLALLCGLVAVFVVAFVSTAEAQVSSRVLIAAMSGDEEAPEDGDDDAYGAAIVDFRRAGGICFRVEPRGVETLNAGHIHRGPRGEAGPVVVPLFTGRAPTRRRCVRVAAALRREIMRFPRRFYVNVHNEDFPGGAVRGPLTR
jgi:hypothetical protein